MYKHKAVKNNDGMFELEVTVLRPPKTIGGLDLPVRTQVLRYGFTDVSAGQFPQLDFNSEEEKSAFVRSAGLAMMAANPEFSKAFSHS